LTLGQANHQPEQCVKIDRHYYAEQEEIIERHFNWGCILALVINTTIVVGIGYIISVLL
jgi:hypothetical protein